MDEEEIIELTLNKVLLKKATKILEKTGFTLETAINIYLKKVVETHGIQFLFED